jgi:2-methylcitrate dehydratase
MPLAEQLADYSLSLQYEHLDDAAIRIAKQRVIDSVGCALGAIDAPPVRSIRAYCETLPDGGATLMFGRKKVTPDAAALLNATMVRFLDFNDGYFSLEPGHSSDNIPAILAVAQAEALSGRDVILAMVVAYEVQMRLQDVACLFRRGWDHVNFVTISAALAVGKLLGLTQTQLVHALSMAMNGHIAMRQVRSGELSGWKGASAANATRNAVVCGYLARHGMTGPNDIFEGEMGFFNQVSGPFALDVSTFGTGSNHDFHIKQARTKLYPTNGEMQTAVMAAVELGDAIPDLALIEAIEVATTDVGFKFLAKDRAKWRPTTRETADHSLPYTVARALLDGTITRATYDASDFADPGVLAIIDKISVHEDARLTAEMPSLANRVTIKLADGCTLEREFGTKKNPRITISDAEIEDKFRSFAVHHYHEQRVQDLLATMWNLETAENLSPMFTGLEVQNT